MLFVAWITSRKFISYIPGFTILIPWKSTLGSMSIKSPRYMDYTSILIVLEKQRESLVFTTENLLVIPHANFPARETTHPMPARGGSERFP